MHLIRELHEQVNYLVEDLNGEKQLFIEGPFLVSEQVNRNKRLYKRDIMQKEVSRYISEQVNQNRAFGELGHPDTPNINLDRVSHLIVSLREQGNVWIGKAKILNTPMGNIAKGLIEGGAQLGISSRGMGSLKSVNGINVVQDDYYLSTAGDIVADPSGPGCFVQSIHENKEWILQNGVWTEKDFDEARNSIRKASKKEIEAVSLQIFENFIKKL